MRPDICSNCVTHRGPGMRAKARHSRKMGQPGRKKVLTFDDPDPTIEGWCIDLGHRYKHVGAVKWRGKEYFTSKRCIRLLEDGVEEGDSLAGPFYPAVGSFL